MGQETKAPFWFLLIQQWKLQGMGHYGVTLPFLVGALARKNGKNHCSVEDVSNLLFQMQHEPIQNYVTEVRWCADVDAPVFSVSRLNDEKRMPSDCHLLGPTGEASIAFSKDLQSMFALNCSSAAQCLARLVDHAVPLVGEGKFSRNMNLDTKQFEFSEFSARELEFILHTGCHDLETKE